MQKNSDGTGNLEEHAVILLLICSWDLFYWKKHLSKVCDLDLQSCQTTDIDDEEFTIFGEREIWDFPPENVDETLFQLLGVSVNNSGVSIGCFRGQIHVELFMYRLAVCTSLVIYLMNGYHRHMIEPMYLIFLTRKQQSIHSILGQFSYFLAIAAGAHCCWNATKCVAKRCCKWDISPCEHHSVCRETSSENTTGAS